ncbi:MAG: DUF4956 domain-containing protein [Clostridiales bacterium]|nr:DUF4956 domain-containing protein [Clostridiales bacterium]
MLDNIFNQFTFASEAITVSGTVLSMIGAIILGLIIAFTYMKTTKAYQQGFTVTLTMLPVILTVIIMFVGSNVARAFSLAGTLSIVRFRSAPGDPKDIAYIFFATAAGLAGGVGMISYGALFVVVVCAFMLILHFTHFGKKYSAARVLKITIPEDLDYEGAFDPIFEKFTHTHTLSKIKTTELGSLYELTYDISLNKNADEKKFIDELRCRNGNLTIVLSLAADMPYGKM